jgi:hypothetical protein
MESTEHRRRNDVTIGIALRRERRRTRRALTNRPVWPPAVEIADILSQHMPQMALVEDQHEVKTLVAAPPIPLWGRRYLRCL